MKQIGDVTRIPKKELAIILIVDSDDPTRNELWIVA